METELDKFDIENSFSPPSANFVHEENENIYDTKEENIEELSKLKKVEVKLTKIDDSKLLDKNENSIDECSKILDELINNVDGELGQNISAMQNTTESSEYFPSPTSTTATDINQTSSPGPSSNPIGPPLVRTHPNGNLPKSGKPMLSDLKRLKQRGRPKAKTVVYQSQVSNYCYIREFQIFKPSFLFTAK
jgi:hypothetical protein